MKTNRIPMFATHNDTTQYAVAVDGLYCLVESRLAALALYASIGGHDGSDGLGDTPFGSAQIIPPGHCPCEPKGMLSDYHQADLADYIAKGYSRQRYRPESPVPAVARLAEHKFWSALGIA